MSNLHFSFINVVPKVFDSPTYILNDKILRGYTTYLTELLSLCVRSLPTSQKSKHQVRRSNLI